MKKIDFHGKLNHFKSQSGRLISKSLVIKKPRFCQKSYDDGKINKWNVPIHNGDELAKNKGKDRHNLIQAWHRAGRRATATGGEQKRWHAIANYKSMMKSKLECAQSANDSITPYYRSARDETQISVLDSSTTLTLPSMEHPTIIQKEITPKPNFSSAGQQRGKC